MPAAAPPPDPHGGKEKERGENLLQPVWPRVLPVEKRKGEG